MMKDKLKVFLKSILLIAFCFTLITSCAKKGCIDKFALNWNDDAEEDDGSCTYNADKMVGNWNVAASFTNDSSSNFSATVAKVDNNHIKIVWSQEKYSSLKVNISEKTMICDGGCSPYFSSTLNNENDFEIYDFAGVENSYPFFGNYHYTR